MMFFFASRRRHTRLQGDWSSDVCSSDLGSFPNRIRVGAGWNVMNSISATGDLTGDGRADIVARDSSGVLWTYRGNGSGTRSEERRVGQERRPRQQTARRERQREDEQSST